MDLVQILANTVSPGKSSVTSSSAATNRPFFLTEGLQHAQQFLEQAAQTNFVSHHLFWLSFP